jgi:hypothetical protein
MFCLSILLIDIVLFLKRKKSNTGKIKYFTYRKGDSKLVNKAEMNKIKLITITDFGTVLKIILFSAIKFQCFFI